MPVSINSLTMPPGPGLLAVETGTFTIYGLTMPSVVGKLFVASGATFQTDNLVAPFTDLISPIVEGGGTLKTEGGVTHMIGMGGPSVISGTLSADGSAVVEFVAGSHSLSPGATLVGSGLYAVDAGVTVSVDAPSVSVSNFGLMGTLTGVGDLKITAYGDWVAGTMTGSGKTTVTAGAIMDISGSAGQSLSGRKLLNSGTINYFDPAGSVLTVGPGTLINNLAGGVFNTLGDQTLAGAGTLRNSGTLNVGGGAGATAKFTIAGNYTQTAAGTLTVEVYGPTAGTGYDQLTVGGTALLNGTLNVVGGAYSPVSGVDDFAVLVCGSDVGTFASILGLTFPSGTTVTPVYSGAGLDLIA
jgi:hypothetical protein